MKKIQLGIFDLSTKPPTQSHDPAIIEFINDIDLKNSELELETWAYKHRHRIGALTPAQQEAVQEYLKKRLPYLN